MANIRSYLNQILTAIFGREVRSSIHDSIQAINSEAEEATRVSLNTKNRQSTLESEWSRVIAQVTEDAEIISARQDIHSIEHPTIGERLDNIESNSFNVEGFTIIANRTIQITNQDDFIRLTQTGSATGVFPREGLVKTGVGFGTLHEFNFRIIEE